MSARFLSMSHCRLSALLLVCASAAPYDNPDLHRQMISDQLRTDAYREALERDPAVVKGKVVMDFGCGTGILSIFAARAGAKKVICVEQTKLSAVTRENIKRNGFEDIIKIVKGSSPELDKKLKGKVDVLVSEWMGYLLILEDMLGYVLEARDKYLKPGGIVWPRWSSVWVQPYQDNGWWDANMKYWWSKPYGIDLSAVGEYANRELYAGNPRAGVWPASGLRCGPAQQLFEWDLRTLVLEKNHETTGLFDFKGCGPRVHGLVIWFDVTFDVHESNVTLSTHPKEGYQHWRQIFWPWDQHQELIGDAFPIEGRIKFERRPPEWQMHIMWRSPPQFPKIDKKESGWLTEGSFGVQDSWLVAEASDAYVRQQGDPTPKRLYAYADSASAKKSAAQSTEL